MRARLSLSSSTWQRTPLPLTGCMPPLRPRPTPSRSAWPPSSAGQRTRLQWICQRRHRSHRGSTRVQRRLRCASPSWACSSTGCGARWLLPLCHRSRSCQWTRRGENQPLRAPPTNDQQLPTKDRRMTSRPQRRSRARQRQLQQPMATPRPQAPSPLHSVWLLRWLPCVRGTSHPCQRAWRSRTSFSGARSWRALLRSTSSGSEISRQKTARPALHKSSVRSWPSMPRSLAPTVARWLRCCSSWPMRGGGAILRSRSSSRGRASCSIPTLRSRPAARVAVR
mmetsp:Transcript_50996/g.150335  ORF Transcript_50996/g.150335 Transcript_50996/m.150335 type:complete len:281 (+) Transcript_50996:1456-2298(+)